VFVQTSFPIRQRGYGDRQSENRNLARSRTFVWKS
jgi:hypothetical protein